MKYMPKNISKYHISDDEKKANVIIYQLSRMGYEACSERDTIKIIEKHGIDTFDFDYPYGSFEEYKKHVLAGKFDVDIKSHILTDDQRKELDKAVKEGKLRVTY